MNTKLVFLIFALCTFIILGCTSNVQEAIPSKDQMIPVVENVDYSYNMTVKEGILEVIPTTNEIVLNLKDVKYSSDENYSNMVMVIQQRQSDKRFDSEIINEKAELLLFKHGLIVALKETKQKFLFALGKEGKLHKNPEGFLKKMDASFLKSLNSSYYGYGVAMMQTEIDDLKTFMKTHTNTYYETDEEILRRGEALTTRNMGECADCSNMNTCDCGGPGSQSCSCNGASTSCYSPCLACCLSGSISKCCSDETVPRE